MTKPPTLTRLLSLLTLVGGLSAAASGCGTTSSDVERGRQLFIENCGTCHVLAQAASSGVQGPNLDDAFRAARDAGMDSDTVEGIVLTQIEFPRPSTDNPAVSMPADLVTGQDAQDVSAYVAKYAGVAGAAPPEAPGGPGAQVFANNGCSGCHTLAAASAGGTTGPNLDEVLPGQTAAQISASITDPEAVITPGFGPGIMPSTYGQQIPATELQQLVSYLVKVSGGGGG